MTTTQSNYDYLDQFSDSQAGAKRSAQRIGSPSVGASGGLVPSGSGLSRQYGGELVDPLDLNFDDVNRLPVTLSQSPARSPRSPSRTPKARLGGLRSFGGSSSNINISDAFDLHTEQTLKRPNSLSDLAGTLKRPNSLSELNVDQTLKRPGSLGDLGVSGTLKRPDSLSELTLKRPDSLSDLNGGSQTLKRTGLLNMADFEEVMEFGGDDDLSSDGDIAGASTVASDVGSDGALSRAASFQGREMFRWLTSSNFKGGNSASTASGNQSLSTMADTRSSGLSLVSGNASETTSDPIYNGAVGALAKMASGSSSGSMGTIPTTDENPASRNKIPTHNRRKRSGKQMKRYRNNQQSGLAAFSANDGQSLKRGFHNTSGQNLLEKMRQEKHRDIHEIQMERLNGKKQMGAPFQLNHLLIQQPQSHQAWKQSHNVLHPQQRQLQQPQRWGSSLQWAQQQHQKPQPWQQMAPQTQLHLQLQPGFKSMPPQQQMSGHGRSAPNNNTKATSKGKTQAPNQKGRGWVGIPGMRGSGRKPAKPWTKQEDELLRQGIERYGEGKWRKIAQACFSDGTTRTSDQIGQRWRKVLRPGVQSQRKGKWTAEESDKLAKLVKIHGDDWEKVAKLMGSRSRKQCKYRWENGIDPHLNRSDWSPDEDAAVIRLVAELGSHWTQIAQSFEGRTDDQVRRRFLKLQNRITSSDSIN